MLLRAGSLLKFPPKSHGTNLSYDMEQIWDKYGTCHMGQICAMWHSCPMSYATNWPLSKFLRLKQEKMSRIFTYLAL